MKNKRLIFLISILCIVCFVRLSVADPQAFSNQNWNGVLQGLKVMLQNNEEITNSTDGIICFVGVGGTNNEDICFNLESNSNRVTMFSNTAVNTLALSGFGMTVIDDQAISMGNSGDFGMAWETTGNDNFQVGLIVGSADSSGYYSIMEKGDMGNANRSPTSNWPNGATPADPTFCVVSSDAAGGADDVICLWHDQGGGFVASGDGDLVFKSPTGYLFLDTDAGGSFTILPSGGSVDQLVFGIRDLVGNQLIITNSLNEDKDHNHATTTDPTLFIHSDTSPDSDDTQWMSLAHVKTGGELTLGFGNLSIEADVDFTGDTSTVGITSLGQFAIDPCSGRADGSLYWRTTNNYLCVCLSGNGEQVSDGTTDCAD